MRTKIIAEAGVNHNGSIDVAKSLIDVAANAGADYVKFQTFKTELLTTRVAGKANYQKNKSRENETQFEMLKNLELEFESHKELIIHCNKRKIKFLSTAFDHESIKVLENLDIPFYKIPSGEITNLPYLRKIGGLGKPVVLSTGMSNMSEIESAMGILLEAGLKKDDLTVLHCNTEYPTPINDVNLLAMISIKDLLNVNIGYSDHTLGFEVSVAAVALGATIIEKHFTINRNMTGPDHAASLEPDELEKMVKAIRNVESAMGNAVKNPSASERKNILIARKSIIAKKQIKKGDTFTEDNLIIKRPGVGLSPMYWDDIMNKESNKDYEIDDLIQL